jgi:uncharacterized protein
MRLVVDTNLIISAFLWQGVPGRLIEMAGEQQVQLYTSRVLLDELVESLHYKKFAKQLLKTELSIAQLLAAYKTLSTQVKARPLANPVSIDPDDDAVLATAKAARADLIVSGDRKHLLILKSFEGIPIVTAAQALTIIDPIN